MVTQAADFFFSSRRRHTRWTGDWSSDVCSSDLDAARVLRWSRWPRGEGVWITVGTMSGIADSVVGMLVSRTGLSPVMVGRGMELARLERLLQRTGEPQVALVGGEAGVGKTRLVQELLTGLPDGAV